MAPVISPSRQQNKQKGPITAADLVAQYKRKGIFDLKRRQLLQDFNGSQASEKLAVEIQAATERYLDRSRPQNLRDAVLPILNDLESRDVFVSASAETVDRQVSNQELLDAMTDMMEGMERPPTAETAPIQPQQVPTRKESKPSIDYLAQLEALKKTQARNAAARPKQSPKASIAAEPIQTEPVQPQIPPVIDVSATSSVSLLSELQDSLPLNVPTIESVSAVASEVVPSAADFQPMQSEPVSGGLAEDKLEATPVEATSAPNAQQEEDSRVVSKASPPSILPPQSLPAAKDDEEMQTEDDQTTKDAENLKPEDLSNTEPGSAHVIPSPESVLVAAAPPVALRQENATQSDTSIHLDLVTDPPTAAEPQATYQAVGQAVEEDASATLHEDQQAEAEDVDMREPTSPLSPVSSDLSAVDSEEDQGPSRRTSGRQSKARYPPTGDEDPAQEEPSANAKKGKPTCDNCGKTFSRIDGLAKHVKNRVCVK